jgi:hypothetical protein
VADLSAMEKAQGYDLENSYKGFTVRIVSEIEI